MISNKNYFDHDADIGIIGYGNTLETCFIDTAKAMFALMTDLSQVQLQKTITIEFEENDDELALVTWLNSLIAKAQAENMVFANFKMQHQNDSWHGEAIGEIWRPELERRIEVKGATLTMLSVKKMDNEWQAKCVVDV